MINPEIKCKKKKKILLINKFLIEKNFFRYFQRADNPLIRNVYSIFTNGSEITKISTGEEGTYSASVSSTGDYYMLVYSGNGEYLSLPSYTLYRFDNTIVDVLEDNAALHEQLSLLNLPTKSYFTIQSADNSVSLNGRLILPPNFNKRDKHSNLSFFFFCLKFFLLLNKSHTVVCLWRTRITNSEKELFFGI